MAKRPLDSTEHVIAALGGVPAVMTLTGANYKQVHQWKQSPTFPSRFYLVMTTALRRRGLSASASLWGMVEEQRRAS